MSLIEATETSTMPKLLARNARLYGAEPGMREKDRGIWKTLSWQDCHDAMRDFALGLAALGFKRGHKLSVVGDNKPRLYLAMLAAQAVGGTAVPVYQDAIASELVYVLNHAEVSVIVAQDQEQVDKVLSLKDQLPNLTAIIFDDRGYPQGTAWAIAPRLTNHHDVAAARFDRRLVISPDSTAWSTTSFVQYLPATTKPRYHGKTVVLVDERTLSQAEHTVLFFEAANHTRIVGSPTMGANGDVTNVLLPGGVTVYFTGQGVRHADGRVLQRTGIIPDITVRPTVKGIRAGRDEVLERALSYLNSAAVVKR